jgi:phage shock protein A
MSPDKERLQALAESAKQLNSHTDKLNESIIALEKKLSGMNVGVSVWIDDLLDKQGPHEREEDTGAIRLGPVPKYRQGYYLGYAKVSSEWRISVKRVEENLDGNGDLIDVGWEDTPTPLVNASRVLRAEAAKQIDRLLDALKERIDEYNANVTSAIESMADNDTQREPDPSSGVPGSDKARLTYKPPEGVSLAAFEEEMKRHARQIEAFGATQRQARQAVEAMRVVKRQERQFIEAFEAPQRQMRQIAEGVKKTFGTK